MKKKTLKKESVSKLKARVWVVFSKYIRTRDCLLTTGCTSWGLCITCGKRYHFKLLQAGHFISGRHNANLFSERGTHAQCYNCNLNLKGNTLIYRRKIIELYGKGVDEDLEEIDKQIYKFTIPDLKELEASLLEKLKILEGK